MKMPYPRRYRKRARRSRRRMPMARMVRRIVNSVPEKKYWEYWFNPSEGSKITVPVSPAGTDSVPATVAPFWTFSSLVTLLGQGFSDGQRIGNKVFIRYIQLAVYVQNRAETLLPGDAQTIASSGMICRYNVFRTRQNNLQAQSDPIPTNTPYTGTGPNYFNVGNFKDKNQLRNFRTLLDAQHQAHVVDTFQQDAETYRSTSGTRVIQHYLKINKRVDYILDRSALVDMEDSTNLQGTDILFGCCANMAGCCLMQVKVRVCYQDA